MTTRATGRAAVAVAAPARADDRSPMTSPTTRGTAARLWPWLRLAAAAGILVTLVWKVGTSAPGLTDARSAVPTPVIGAR
ncbi:hypothetical protein GCM10022380_11120 [Amycolatopsis tucumanensis]|uniref:Uncharacterized protein n=1 Tax=Amycolatopsis tucumanensis TaxID=401106 RepID=A0ABP7HIE5_9PSEU